jgi:hypothetical protein
VTIFTYPETGSCPLQTSKDFNLSIKANLKQLKVVLMFEHLMRMLDYINFQIVRVISPAGTYQDDNVQQHHHKQ